MAVAAQAHHGVELQLEAAGMMLGASSGRPRLVQGLLAAGGQTTIWSAGARLLQHVCAGSGLAGRRRVGRHRHHVATCAIALMRPTPLACMSATEPGAEQMSR